MRFMAENFFSIYWTVELMVAMTKYHIFTSLVLYSNIFTALINRVGLAGNR